MVRLKVSVDSRYRDRIAKSGSIMLCELQGAAEDFMFDRMTTYLNTVKEM